MLSAKTQRFSSQSLVTRLTVSAMMIALATVINFVCMLIPFLNLPFGGGFTIGSMLPIVLIAYLYGIPWGAVSALVYSVIQLLFGLTSVVIPLFTPTDESYMGIASAILICLIDYILAYTVLCIGGVFRKSGFSNAKALCLGSILALAARYVCHIFSGAIFYGLWAEWFFGQEGFPLGQYILSHISGWQLSLLYSIVYNGLYMIPEIVITAILAVVVARIPQVRPYNVQSLS